MASRRAERGMETPSGKRIFISQAGKAMRSGNRALHMPHRDHVSPRPRTKTNSKLATTAATIQASATPQRPNLRVVIAAALFSHHVRQAQQAGIRAQS